MRILAALATLTGFGLTLAACSKAPDQPIVASSEQPTLEATDAVLEAEPSMAPTEALAEGVVSTALDVGSLAERRDPERLLRFYVSALKAGNWEQASKAWSLNAQMAPSNLERQFGGAGSPRIAVGKGDMDTAAGTVFYEAPVVIDFGSTRPAIRGKIVLSRVNDVPGASQEQLVWRIQRMTTLKP